MNAPSTGRELALLPAADLRLMIPAAVVERLRALGPRMVAAYAPNTLRGLESHLKLWWDFCGANGGGVLPDAIEPIEAFLIAARDGQLPADRAALAASRAKRPDAPMPDRARKRGTLDQYVAAICVLYRMAAVQNPMDSEIGKLALRAIRKSLPKRQKQAPGLVESHLAKILAQLKPSVPLDARDAALISVAYETLMRRAEIVAMNLEHIEAQPDGTHLVLLPRSKTDQEGEGDLRYISPETVALVRHWCAVAAIDSGPLWRTAYGFHGKFLRRMGAGEIARIFKRRARAAGVPVPFSGHSTRVGAAQDMAANNASMAGIMQSGGWKTPTMVGRYTKAIEVGRGAMAQMRKAKRPLPVSSDHT